MVVADGLGRLISVEGIDIWILMLYDLAAVNLVLLSAPGWQS
jgi:hypothetical protein